MSKYLNSGMVAVFPATRRAEGTPNSRQFTEHAISNIVNKLVDKDSFVAYPIYTDSETVRPADGMYSNEANSKLNFNIAGYNFSVDYASLIAPFESFNSIYGIIIIDTSTSLTYVELKGTDETVGSDNKYRGISFDYAKPTGTGWVGDNYRGFKKESTQTTYYLKILEKSDQNWVVPHESLIRFSPDILLSTIDGGIII